ncbi:polycystin-2-like [Clytia hemisphaerica]
MAFGNQRSLDWLLSTLLSFVQDIFLFQPAQIFLAALISALLSRRFDDGVVEKFNLTQIWKRERRKSRAANSDVIDLPTSFVAGSTFDPPGEKEMESMRHESYKRQQFAATLRGIVYQICFAFVVFVIANDARRSSAYHLATGIRKMLKAHKNDIANYTAFEKVHSPRDVWPWLSNVILPEVFPEPWFSSPCKNGNSHQRSRRSTTTTFSRNEDPGIRDFPGRLYLNDLYSKVVTGMRLRHVRTENTSCVQFSLLNNNTNFKHCIGVFNLKNTEKGSYGTGWSKLTGEQKQHDHPTELPWIYKTSEELGSFPILATQHLYPGGGYAVQLFPKSNWKSILGELKDHLWLDRYSRALILELDVYNAAEKQFISVRMVLEIEPFGGIIPFITVTPVTLDNDSFWLICNKVAFFCLFMLFAYREYREILASGFSYLKSFWNIIEICLLAFICLAIYLEFTVEKYRSELTTRVNHRKPYTFIDFQVLAYTGLLFQITIGFVSFFVMIKVIRLLRFNRRISILTKTLKRALPDLAAMGLHLLIIYIASVIFSHMLLGVHLHQFSDFWKTAGTIISIMLNKFKVSEIIETKPILGRIGFFVFTVLVNFIVLNILISILNDSIAETENELDSCEQERKDEFLEYVKEIFTDLIRCVFRFRCCCRRSNKKPPSKTTSPTKQTPITLPPPSRVVQVKEFKEHELTPDEKRHFFFHSSPTPIHRPLRDEKQQKKKQAVNFQDEIQIMDYEETSIHTFKIEDDSGDENVIDYQQSPPQGKSDKALMMSKYQHVSSYQGVANYHHHSDDSDLEIEEISCHQQQQHLPEISGEKAVTRYEDVTSDLKIEEIGCHQQQHLPEISGEKAVKTRYKDVTKYHGVTIYQQQQHAADSNAKIEEIKSDRQQRHQPEISDQELITKYQRAIKCLKNMHQSDVDFDAAWQKRMIGLLHGMMEDCLCE